MLILARAAGLIWALLVVVGWSEGSGREPSSGSKAGLEGEEAALAAPVLADENVRLRERVEQLETQIAELVVELAEKSAALDGLQLARDPLAVSSGPVADDRAANQSLDVIEVNSDLALVVIRGGSFAGLKRGMMLAVLRGERVVARVRVLDVRKMISGARLEAVLGDVYPQQGDRVIMWRSSM